MATERELSEIQRAFIQAGVVQCGYCTPAFLLATEALLERHESPSRAQIRDAFSGLFCRCTGYEQMFTAVDLASRRLRDPSYAAKTAPEFREDLRVVGKVKQKVDAPRLVRAAKAYVEDMVEEGACHLRLLGSPHAHAYIKSIDTSLAEATPGVILVITHVNGPDVYYNQAGQGFPEPSPYDRKMFGQKVLHVGDRVAAVVAESDAIARAALKKIKVEYGGQAGEDAQNSSAPGKSTQRHAEADSPSSFEAWRVVRAKAADGVTETTAILRIADVFEVRSPPRRTDAAMHKAGH